MSVQVFESDVDTGLTLHGLLEVLLIEDQLHERLDLWHQRALGWAGPVDFARSRGFARRFVLVRVGFVRLLDEDILLRLRIGSSVVPFQAGLVLEFLVEVRERAFEAAIAENCALAVLAYPTPSRERFEVGSVGEELDLVEFVIVGSSVGLVESSIVSRSERGRISESYTERIQD